MPGVTLSSKDFEALWTKYAKDNDFVDYDSAPFDYIWPLKLAEAMQFIKHVHHTTKQDWDPEVGDMLVRGP